MPPSDDDLPGAHGAQTRGKSGKVVGLRPAATAPGEPIPEAVRQYRRRELAERVRKLLEPFEQYATDEEMLELERLVRTMMREALSRELAFNTPPGLGVW